MPTRKTKKHYPKPQPRTSQTTVMPIIALPQHLVNRIAAGEVVERPASVVKELLENSLDAHATQVTIDIEEGGKKLIRITDNGSGIPADQLHLAVAPHATSKIKSDQDLFAINSFGFRGEALASIASISQTEILSRPAEATEGALITVTAGQASDVSPAPSPPGTTITVRNLFMNTPARRKFLRTASTEMGHITEQFTRVALAHTDVALTLNHNNRTVHQLPAGQSLRQRIAALFNPELADSVIAVNRQDPDAQISGLIAPPQAARSGSQWQYVFLNRRFIRDRFVTHAIREAYRSMLEVNRQPVVFIFITIPPDAVDVNVHPAKIEVRFADSNRIHSQVLAAIRDRLLSTDLSVDFQPSTAGILPASLTPQDPNQPAESEEDRRRRVRQAMVDFFKNQPPNSHSNLPSPNTPATTSTAPPFTLSPSAPPQTKPLNFTNNQPTPTTDTQDTTSIETPDTIAPRAFVQIHNTYIVAETPQGLIIIDQHALHERILYEQLNDNLLQGPLPTQRLLIPETIDVTAAHIAALEDAAPILADLGIIIEQFGPTTIALQGLPPLLARTNPTTFVTELLDFFVANPAKKSREEILHPILDIMACKAAVKAGDPLTPQEIQNLLKQLPQTNRPTTCPHGRPTTINLTLAQLEKQFKRT
ncbi:MAG: DNA mismatch repair endonuclease MutL [Sedimentisphaerales bacterium]|nr:DNA mismatch repair endonuclease MutL [Sedimentisphaerales bacterium]